MNAKPTILSGIDRQVDLSGADILSSLPADELVGLLDRLRAFVFNRYYGTLSCEDLAMEAMKRVLAGHRGWDSDYPPFENLCWIIRSLADNQRKKDERSTSLESSSELNISKAARETLRALNNSSPADIYETARANQEIRSSIKRAIRGDGMLGRIVEFALDAGDWKPRTIAKELQIDMRQVHNAKRRMQRRLAATYYKH